ncbi:glycosyltransferase [Candidatus Marinimicrobia bacterium]|nr:glycosyltransferase [Candidatus Neomarinimicrobiota bacterium]
MLSKKYDIDFTVTSSCKDFEKNDIYYHNKKIVQQETKLRIKEFEKRLTNKQSILTFFKDIYPQVKFAIKEAKRSDLIHCRGYGASVIGYIASIVSNKPFIFDMRGLLPEETVDVGKISKNSIKFRLLKFVENFLIRRSNLIFTVSEKFNTYIKQSFKISNSINLNNPTDFNMYHKNNDQNKRINFIYSGSNQVWHLPEQTIEIFSELEKKYKDKVFLYFCCNDKLNIRKIFDKFDVPKDSYEINQVPFNKMPNYYSKSNIAFCLIKNSFSKSVCFPVKFSEYIASNLYVIGNKNIGDIPDIITKYRCGLVLSNIDNIKSSVNEIDTVVDNMLNRKIIHYDRNSLSFLDWNQGGIDMIFNSYKKLTK